MRGYIKKAIALKNLRYSEPCLSVRSGLSGLSGLPESGLPESGLPESGLSGLSGLSGFSGFSESGFVGLVGLPQPSSGHSSHVPSSLLKLNQGVNYFKQKV